MSLKFNLCVNLSGYVKCQCCNNKFPKEFADRCLGWYGGVEKYDIHDLHKYLGTDWKNYDSKGQWYLWKDDFICPECAQKLIDNEKAKLVTYYYEYFTTCDYEELPQDIKQYAKPHKWSDSTIPPSGSDVKIPYNVLGKTYKKRIKLK